MATNVDTLKERAGDVADSARGLAEQAEALARSLGDLPARAAEAGQAAGDGHNLVIGLTVFVLAIFVGYHVVWRVTPALHSPLMAVTNAVSSVIIVGALIAAGPGDFSFSQAMGLIAIALASVNIFGGFIVTQRMLSMFTKKK
ncbi:NAD(P) transhydrogenase subunit alpha [Ferruginivarius sediminum]|uniref:proton-translocating NAD(P)(+) transhydrogenase n=1 Tax=Ferruginivarius sediminum TaxID=2661937 RepID=A0A369T8V6_9PROT|nr:NAD(P) transhydrogenase subunit alpha [Ferruginivarius sediminum]RDD61761.1 NAD(P) transhydrogenase subunit alpha [Ferruginivarius sediminum]